MYGKTDNMLTMSVLMEEPEATGGGGFSAKFRLGVCRPQFQMEPLARPIFVKMIPLARLISPLKVP